jgi:hypothetical protein
MGLSAVFAGLTTVLLVLTLAARQPLLLAVAVPFGATTFFMWYQASGRMEARFRRRAAQGRARTADDGRGREFSGFGAGARQAAWDARYDARAGRRTADGGRRRAATATTELSQAEAYRALGIDADPADGVEESTVREAYRERVKDVHPDRGGDEETFKRVTEAYETLTGD